MRGWAWRFAFSSYLLSASLSLPSHSGLDLLDTSTRITNLASPRDGQIPKDFRAFPRDPGHELDPMASLVNSINILGELALEDFEGEISRPTLHRYNLYQSVFFGIIPPTGSTLKRKYAIWGIWAGINSMIQENEFQETTFNLESNGELIGFVYFRHKPVPDPTLGAYVPDQTRVVQSSDDIASQDRSMSTAMTVFNASVVGDAPLKLGLVPIGEPIKTDIICDIILTGLLKAAPHKRSDIIDEEIEMRADHLGLGILFLRPDPPRKRPPFFRYQHLIMALMQVPEFSVRKKRFGEVRMELEVGHSMVATGYILRTAPPTLSSVASDNVTVS